MVHVLTQFNLRGKVIQRTLVLVEVGYFGKILPFPEADWDRKKSPKMYMRQDVQFVIELATQKWIDDTNVPGGSYCGGGAGLNPDCCGFWRAKKRGEHCQYGIFACFTVLGVKVETKTVLTLWRKLSKWKPGSSLTENNYGWSTNMCVVTLDISFK